MLIALLTDIHANREALTACLADAHERGAERHIFLGDYVGYGADPGWAVDTIAGYVARGAVALRGNHDAAVVTQDRRMNDAARQAIDWTRDQLDAAQKEFLAARPLMLEEAERLFVHASAHTPERWEYVTGTEEAERSLQATACRQTFCGHVHVPQVYHLSVTGKIGFFVPVAGTPIPLLLSRRWLAVIGAVGQPRDYNPAACYGLLDDERGTLTYARVPYDVAAAARKIREAGLPIILSHRLGEGY